MRGSLGCHEVLVLMERGTFIALLFGKGDRPSVTLPHPLNVVRHVVSDKAMRRPGWLIRICQQHLDRHGDRALQLVRTTGEALVLVHSPRATIRAAQPAALDVPKPRHPSLLD